MNPAEFVLRRLDPPGLRELYARRVRADFPPAERRPLGAMERLTAEGVYEPLAFGAGEEIAGYAMLWRCGGSGVTLLDYLAVVPKLRGQGVGSALLARLLARDAGETLLVEAEAEKPGVPLEENARRRARLAFYRRAGFETLPYEAEIFGVHYAALAGGAPCPPERAMAAHRRLYRGELGTLRYWWNVKIPYVPKGRGNAQGKKELQ